MAVVGSLITYPVKSCAGVSLSHAELTIAGLAHDRAFMVTGPDGTFRSQRRDPRLALIRPEVCRVGASSDPGSEGGGERLILRAPDIEELAVDVDLDGTRREVTLFGQPYRGIDQGDDTAEWLTSVLAAPSRLVRVPPEQDRVVFGWISGHAAYSDSGALHVVSGATLDGLNRRLGSARVPMSRFRPNIVIEGWDEPHLEDEARYIVIGETKLGFAKQAIRCAIPMIDQRTGRKAGPEPLRTLAAYRRAVGGGIAFGAKFSVLKTGKLAVGDGVTVLSWATGHAEPDHA